ncbi:MAG: CBS domain-containing protein [Halofilum sp. (in: g-proteobacteria)]
MQARDVMTSHVVSVGPDDTVADVAQVLMEHGISAAPVIDRDELVGIVSEGDLVRRAEIGTAEQNRSWWLQLFTAESKITREYVKTHASRVRDVMQDKVVTVAEDTPLHEIAATLERNRIKRVPVVKSNRVVGIVSRADIVQQLAAHRQAPLESRPSDNQIREKVESALRSHGWRNPIASSVTVTDGVVDLWGIYRTEDEHKAARVAAESIEGVQRVDDHRMHMRMPYTG